MSGARPKDEERDADRLAFWIDRLSAPPRAGVPGTPLEIAREAIDLALSPALAPLPRRGRPGVGAVVTARLTQGRLVLSAVLDSLGWSQGTLLAAAPASTRTPVALAVATLTARKAVAPAVATTVGARGRLLVPAPIRDWLSLSGSDEVTVVALPTPRMAVLLPRPTLSGLLAEALFQVEENPF